MDKQIPTTHHENEFPLAYMWVVQCKVYDGKLGA